MPLDVILPTQCLKKFISTDVDDSQYLRKIT